MRPPKPRADSRTESASKRASGRVSVTFRTHTAPSARASRAIGRMIQKIACHVSVERMTPDTVGPTAGATAMTTLMTPIIRPRCEAGTMLRTVVNSSGIMIAVPEACTTRPVSSTAKVGASAAMSVPIENSVIAVKNTRRSGKRSSR